MKRSLFFASIVSLIGLPLCVIVHELGHFAAAQAFGWMPRLFPDKVTYQAEAERWQRLVFLTAGPLIDVILITLGIAILFALRTRIEAPRSLLFWMGTLLACVSVKWLLTPFAAMYVPMNDERQISALLGWHPMLLPCIVMLAGVSTFVFIGRQHRRHGSLRLLPIVALSGIAGAGIWIKLLGPLLIGVR